MPETIYTVRDEQGISYPVFDADRAERLSREGLRVSATTRRMR